MPHNHGADRKDDLHIGSVAANMNEESRTADGRYSSVLDSVRRVNKPSL
jgi:hypothetical protein